MQLDELREFTARRGWTVVAEYVDHGESGAKDRRPKLDGLMTHVRRGGVDVVACWRFDRFARSVRHLVLALDEFRSLSVDFVSVRDAIDTGTPAGRFTFTVIAAVAELERELIRERTIAGVARARRLGKRLGRPCAERRTASQGPRLDVEAAKQAIASGVSIRAAAWAQQVGEATLRRALARAAASESSSGGSLKLRDSQAAHEHGRAHRNRSFSTRSANALARRSRWCSQGLMPTYGTQQTIGDVLHAPLMSVVQTEPDVPHWLAFVQGSMQMEPLPPLRLAQ